MNSWTRRSRQFKSSTRKASSTRGRMSNTIGARPVRKPVYHNHVEGIEGLRVSSPRKETWMVDRNRHGDRALHRLRPWMPSTRHGDVHQKTQPVRGPFQSVTEATEDCVRLCRNFCCPDVQLPAHECQPPARKHSTRQMLIASGKRCLRPKKRHGEFRAQSQFSCAASLWSMGQKNTRLPWSQPTVSSKPFE